MNGDGAWYHTLEFAFSRLRHAIGGDAPLCGTRSKWKPTPSSNKKVTCQKCLAVLARSAEVTGTDLFECMQCGAHVGGTADATLGPHRQPTTRKPWCCGFGTPTGTLRQVGTHYKNTRV